MRRLKLKLKTLVIDASLDVERWAGNLLCVRLPADGSVPKRLRLFWWIQGWTGMVFGWAYSGSAEEIEDGIDNAHLNTEDKYLTPLQIEIKRRWPEWIDCEEVP